LTTYLHALWYSPVQISLALYFLFRLLGPSSLGGVAVMLCMVPITKFVAQWMGGMQKRLMKARDERVELNSEVLAGMKVIKFQAWEESFQKRILDLRANELTQLFRYFLGTTTSRVLWTFTPLLVALATFAAYVWSGHQLDVASALTALALFEILRFPLAMLPQVINNTVEAAVSLNRIRSFLLCDEHVSPATASPSSSSDPSCVALRSVTAKANSNKQNASNPQELAEKEWEVSLLRSQLREAERMIRELSGQESTSSIHEVDNDEAPLCLKRVDLECRPGELVAVVGGVGSGKSSVLASILGEVQTVSGSLHVAGSLAYHSQIPFIMNATVRDNILFGHVDDPFDADRYDRAIDACALRHDLELLPYGDATEIGEKGVTLSGGTY
jgi:ATP-binding cassette, subfamily C (CFTR/MRP), member 1